jgi:hypothetical protein
MHLPAQKNAVFRGFHFTQIGFADPWQGVFRLPCQRGRPEACAPTTQDRDWGAVRAKFQICAGYS